jgi:hypothetical protein
MAFKVIVSVVFVAVFFVRIIKPEWNIDSTSIILLVLACVPWFIQYVKSLEINGVGKIELIDDKKKKEIEQKVKDAGIVPSQSNDTPQYAFYNLRYDDPKLALAGLRIEIESVLRKIAEKNGLDVSHSGLGRMTDILSQHELISSNERGIIFDITGILNKAVHSQLDEFQSESVDWVFDLGLDILKSLNARL